LHSYWRIPDRLYDEPDELAEWARLALAAAKRSQKGSVRNKNSAKSVKPKRA
jgi:DNA transformation protein